MPSCYKNKKADCKEPCIWTVGKGCGGPKTPDVAKPAKVAKPKTPGAKIKKFDVQLFSDCFDKFEYNARWKKEGPACVKAMLDHLKSLAPGTNVNVQFPESTIFPLYAAIVMQVPEIVEALIAAGANPNKGFKNEPKPIHVAANGKSSQILKMVIDAGGNVNDKGDDETPLELACIALLPENIAMLASNGAKMYRDNISVAMRVLEVRKRNVEDLKLECIKALVKNGLDVNYKMKRQDKFFTIVDKAKKDPIAEYLRKL